MTQAEAATRIRDYLTENFLYLCPTVVLTDTDSLLATGVIDSMGVIEIISFVESALGVHIDDADVTEEMIGTIAALSRYVADRAAVAA